jgi:hypothetical protein
MSRVSPRPSYAREKIRALLNHTPVLGHRFFIAPLIVIDTGQPIQIEWLARVLQVQAIQLDPRLGVAS